MSYKADRKKQTVQVTFYRDITEVVDGQEKKDFGKSVIAVDKPHINGVKMQESVDDIGRKL